MQDIKETGPINKLPFGYCSNHTSRYRRRLGATLSKGTPRPKKEILVSAIMASAIKHTELSLWIIADRQAYLAARKYNILDSICQHMHIPSLDELLASAKGYPNKTAWGTKEPTLYTIALDWGSFEKVYDVVWGARRPVIEKVYDVVRGARRPIIEKHEAVASAHNHTCSKEWKKGDPSAYAAAIRNGWFPEATANFTRLRRCPGFYTKEVIVGSAKIYQTKQDWINADPAPYAAAQKKGLLNDIDVVGHMIDGSPSDNDTVYIWQAVDKLHNALPVYKLGITSARLGDQRIKAVAKKWGFDFKIIALTPVVGQATHIEVELLKLGTNPGYECIDGASEFRALTDLDLAYAVSIIRANALPTYLEHAA